MSNTIIIPGVGALDAAQVALILAHGKAQDEANAAAVVAARAGVKALTRTLVEYAVDKLPRTTFKSTAQGYSVGGGKVTYMGITYVVSATLIRDEATIPPKEEA